MSGLIPSWLWARFEFRHGRRECFRMRAQQAEIRSLPEARR